jgi:hypothetical protein
MTREQALDRCDQLQEAIERSPFKMSAEKRELQDLLALIDRMDEGKRTARG